MARYKTIGMTRQTGLDKDVHDLRQGNKATTYLTERERIGFLVTVDPESRQLMQGGHVFQTNWKGEEEFIFVMDADGRIFSESKAIVNHHSSFLAGGPVAAAGFIRVVNGQLVEISNSSGHYMPPAEYTEQLIKELKRLGHPVGAVRRRYNENRKARAIEKDRKKYRQGPLQRMGSKGWKDSWF